MGGVLPPAERRSSALVALYVGVSVLMLLIGLGGQYQPRRWRKGIEGELGRWPAVARGAALAAAVLAIELLGPSGIAPFIYFQF